MKIKNSRTTAIILLVAVSFMLLGAYSGSRYRAVKAREARNRILQLELKKADAMADNSAAATAYKKLNPLLPEVQLRILQRQWRLAMELLQYMQRARYNTELQNETGVYSTRLTSLLDEMLERCSGMLSDAETLRPDILWQVYNAAGSARVIRAFAMLEDGQNVDKVQGVMRDALTDFKAAIKAVDKAAVPPFQKNIPRWNFELLNGEGYVQKFEVAMTDMEKKQLLKENLETLMPEMGGYAPVNPLKQK